MKSKTKKRTLIYFLLLVGIIGLGFLTYYFLNKSNDNTAPAKKQAQTVKPLNRSKHNIFDVDSARKAILYSQQAQKMSSAAQVKASSTGLQNLALEAYGEYEQEAARYTGLLDEWNESYRNLSDFSEEDGHDMYPTSQGMATADEMKDLETLTGEAFEVEYIRLLTQHHNGFAEFTKATNANAQNARLEKLRDDTKRLYDEELKKLKSL